MLSWILAATTGLAVPSVQPEAELTWDAPPSCPSGGEVRAAVVQLAGRWPGASEFEARGRVRGDGERWTLELSTRVGGHEHQQQLEARTCEGLADAAALILAVSLDPIASAAAVELVQDAPAPLPMAVDVQPEPEVVPAPTSGAASEAASEARPEPGARAEQDLSRVHLLLGAGGDVGSGFSPGASGGPRLAFGLAGDHLRLTLEGRYWAPKTVTADTGAGARLQAGFVAAVGCWTSGHPQVEAMACLGVESGALRARGLSVVGGRTQHFPRLAALARMGLAWHVRPRIGLTAGLDVALSAVDAVVVVGPADDAGSETVYRTPRIGARGTLGIEFSIPVPKR